MSEAIVARCLPSDSANRALLRVRRAWRAVAHSSLLFIVLAPRRCHSVPPAYRRHRPRPPERPARQSAGVLAAFDHDRAIDDHRPDAGRLLVRVVEVDRSMIVAGSNRTTSAAWPSRRVPRSARPSAAAAPPVIFAIAWGKVSRPRSRA